MPPGVHGNRGLESMASLFAYNTSVSSSIEVTPHYAMFGPVAVLPVDLVFLTPSVE